MKRFFRSFTPEKKKRVKQEQESYKDGDSDSEYKSGGDYLSEDLIARILELEITIGTDHWTMKLMHELVMLYSVSYPS